MAQAGGAEIFIVRDLRFGLVTGDVLRKKYIMLTNFTLYVHKGAAEFLYCEMSVATYLGGGGPNTEQSRPHQHFVT